MYSPRIAFVWRPSALHSFRATFNRAFTTPANYQFFADEFLQPLNPGLPYELRLLGVPDEGFRFERSCSGGTGGLCMRTPFAPGAFVAADAAPAPAPQGGPTAPASSWTPSTADLASFAGTYYSPELETTYTLSVVNGRLVVQRRRAARIELTPTTTDSFVARGVQFRFTRETGRITGFAVDAGRTRNLRFDKTK